MGEELVSLLNSSAGGLAHVPLADGLPTPIEEAAALGASVGVDLFVKRDDQTCSLYGGNKVRKLEWLLADAQAQGARATVTVGAWGTHHGLSTAVHAAKLGMKAYTVVFPQPWNPHVEDNVYAQVGVGARLVPVAHIAGVPFGNLRAKLHARLRGLSRPYVVPPGGSNALGAMGYVDCGLEIARQIEQGVAPCPAVVVAAVGTCSTAAGLALGLGMGARWVPELAKTRVVGVRVVPAVVTPVARVKRLAAQARGLLERAGVDGPLTPLEVSVVGSQLGQGYGHATEAAQHAKHSALSLAGLDTETTYTAKALAAILDDGAGFAGGGPVLYVHTLNGASIDAWVQRGVEAGLPPSLRCRLDQARTRAQSKEKT